MLIVAADYSPKPIVIKDIVENLTESAASPLCHISSLVVSKRDNRCVKMRQPLCKNAISIDLNIERYVSELELKRHRNNYLTKVT